MDLCGELLLPPLDNRNAAEALGFPLGLLQKWLERARAGIESSAWSCGLS